MTYVYKCTACKTYSETQQKITDKPLTTCSNCGGKVHRVMFPPGVIFKGSGFYKTDYSGKKNMYGTPTTTSEYKEVSAPKE